MRIDLSGLVVAFSLLHLLIISIFNSVLFYNFYNTPYLLQLGSFGLLFNFTSLVFAILCIGISAVPVLISSIYFGTVSFQTVVTLGFWILKFFFKDITIFSNESQNWLFEIGSLYTHGGSLINLVLYAGLCNFQFQYSLFKKIILHLCWAVPCYFAQYIYYFANGKHSYEFMDSLSSSQIILLQFGFFAIVIVIDYIISLKMDPNIKSLSDFVKLFSREEPRQAQIYSNYIQKKKR